MYTVILSVVVWILGAVLTAVICHDRKKPEQVENDLGVSLVMWPLILPCVIVYAVWAGLVFIVSSGKVNKFKS